MTQEHLVGHLREILLARYATFLSDAECRIFQECLVLLRQLPERYNLSLVLFREMRRVKQALDGIFLLKQGEETDGTERCLVDSHKEVSLVRLERFSNGTRMLSQGYQRQPLSRGNGC